MRRRDFIASLAAALVATRLPLLADNVARHPRLLISASDPFTGLHILKCRYALGRRPSEDMEGYALSWRLTGNDDFAERALSEIRKSHLSASGKPSKAWVDYARWALTIDWLYDFRGFDTDLKNRITSELHDGALAMLSTPDFRDPGNYSFHNYSVRYLALAAFASAGLWRDEKDARYTAWNDTVNACLQNVLNISDFITPDGSYHESMDYMRITLASLVMIAELQRTSTGLDPAYRHSVLRNITNTYLYKLLPDGTPSREGDNEYPVLDSRDTTLLGYAVNRFKDPYAAWLLRESGFFPKQWVLPVLEFLWDDPEVGPRDPSISTESELSRQRYFAGVGHLVMRDGWKPDSTWIEFDCGPYLAKHQHLDQNQFTIYHRGYLAIDSGADYTDTESPHYLNYYRRTVAHNSVLVYDPKEKFFWSDNVVPAANDGGQRMNSARYWNTIRSYQDFERTRDVWDIGSMKNVDHVPGKYHYALGDATKAYSSEKLQSFRRELLYSPESKALFVFDRVVSTDKNFRKAWLLHGVNPPTVDHEEAAAPGSKDYPGAKNFKFTDGNGELFVHSLLPREHVITRRGGRDNEFHVPGDDNGGAWGTGQNWPLEGAAGSPLPSDPKLQRMWKLFWGSDFDKILPSNRKNVVPGSWRIEVSPRVPAEEDLFLNVLEIGDLGMTGKRAVELLDGVSLKGAAIEAGPIVLFSSSGSIVDTAEVSLPALPCTALIVSGLHPETVYELSLGGLNISDDPKAVLPGVSVGVKRLQTNRNGILFVEDRGFRSLRLRLSKL